MVEDNFGDDGFCSGLSHVSVTGGATFTRASRGMSAFAKDQWQPPNGVGIESPHLGGNSDREATVARESPRIGEILGV